jgi:hypothetical protein
VDRYGQTGIGHVFRETPNSPISRAEPTSQYQSGLGEWFRDLASTKALDLASAAIEEHRNLLEFPLNR